MHEWLSGYRDVGLGSVSPAPTMLAFVGGLGYLFFGAMSLLRTVLILGALPLGVLGIWRMARPLGSRRARIVILVVYACVPVGLQRHGPGSLDRARHVRPRAVDDEPAAQGLGAGAVRVDRRRSRARACPSARSSSGSCCSASPPRWRPWSCPSPWSSVPAIAIAFVLGSLLVGEVRGSGRLLGVAFGGVAHRPRPPPAVEREPGHRRLAGVRRHLVRRRPPALAGRHLPLRDRAVRRAAHRLGLPADRRARPAHRPAVALRVGGAAAGW